MALEFRPMTREDVPGTFSVRLSTLENAISMESIERDYGITPDSLVADMACDVKGWVCSDAGRIVGFAMGNVGTAEVLVVAVRPGYEGRGIGAGVLGRVRDWLFAAGHRKIWLLSNPDPALRAYGFYRALGWRPTGEMTRDDEVLALAAERR